MEKVLTYIDELATRFAALHPEHLRRLSEVVDGLVYEYGATFRQVCMVQRKAMAS